MNSFKIIYKSRLVEPEVKKVNCSNQIIKTYDLQYDSNHIVKVVETGKVNIYEKIQTFAQDVDFTRILRTIELTGNPGLYAAKQNGDIDLRNVPDDLVELKQLEEKVNSAKNTVKNDEYFKSKGVPFEEFVKQFNTKDYYDFLKSKYEKKEVAKDE